MAIPIVTVALACALIPCSCSKRPGDVEKRPSARAATGRTGLHGREATATFAAGCFWGVENTFRQLDGVTATRVGYAGGDSPSPTYRQVCGGRTGHAEAVEVTYDPDTVSYDDLLAAFWFCHDPTTPNRQGPDFGSQYRSAIFFHSPQQMAAAVASRDRHQVLLHGPIVTEIVAAGDFYEAEDYHQQYMLKRGLDSCGRR